jgi:hypothetical protein
MLIAIPAILTRDMARGGGGVGGKRVDGGPAGEKGEKRRGYRLTESVKS